MKNRINSIIDKINYIIIICLVCLVPITFFINYFSLYHFNSSFSFKLHQALTFILPIEIGIYFYKLLTRKIKIDIYDLLIYLLILIGLISTICAINPDLAVWGSKYRFEGLIQILTYYFLFLNSRFIIKKDMVIKFINFLIGIGLLQFLYSVLQVFVRGNYIFVKQEIVSYRASGFIGHPNMLGSYVVLTLLLSIGMYFLYDKHKRFYLVSSILLYINLVLAQSTGPYYGFLAAIVFLVVYLFKKKKISTIQIIKTCVIVISLLVLVTGVSKLWCESVFTDKFRNDFTITGDISDTCNTIWKVITSNVDSNEYGVTAIETYGSNRIWLWSRSVKLIPKYWLHGTGIDNFGKAFSDSLSEKDKNIYYLGGRYFDRAHNDYLQLAITQGVFALIIYLSLLLIVFIQGLKNSNALAWVLLFSFVGYSIQAFANISVYNVTPFFFIVMGMLVGQINVKE